MAAGRGLRNEGGKGSSHSDLFALVLGYAKQETLGPLRGLGRFVLAGAIGSVSLSMGAGLLLLALLRALQTETGSTFGGDLSWAPYLLTAGVTVGIALLAAQRIAAGPAARRSRSSAEKS